MAGIVLGAMYLVGDYAPWVLIGTLWLVLAYVIGYSEYQPKKRK
jgi:hypothetical protein